MQQLTFESYMNKELVRKQADGACADLLQGPGAPVRGGACMKRWRRWNRDRRLAAAAFCVAVLGALMTDLGPWYAQPEAARLEAARLGLRPDLDHDLRAGGGRRRASAGDARRPRADRELMLVLFAANGFLNVFWSLLYFRLHRPDWALYEVPFLWLSVLALILVLGALCQDCGMAARALPRLGRHRGVAELGNGSTERAVRRGLRTRA